MWSERWNATRNDFDLHLVRGCFGLLVERSFWFLPRRPKSVYPLLSREEHSHAASHAHSPRPSSHVEAVGQHRGRTAAHTHCQAPRDVAAPLRLAPSRLQLPVRGPAPFEGVCRWSHATDESCRAEPSGTYSSIDLHGPGLVEAFAPPRMRALLCSCRLTTTNSCRMPRGPPLAAGRRRAGAGARREGRLQPLDGRLNARACLGNAAWLQVV